VLIWQKPKGAQQGWSLIEGVSAKAGCMALASS
jgi:hypothetical protein